MPDATAEQAQAATVEARRMMANALGLADDRPACGTSPLFESLWTQHQHHPRCSHLTARPIQPSLMVLPFAGWMCRPCGAVFAEARRGKTFDPIEEFTCDRCRCYVGNLTPLIVRQDLWIFILSVCGRCEVDAIRQGAQHQDTPA